MNRGPAPRHRTLHLGHLAAPAPVRGRFLRVGRLVQGPARGLVLGQGPPSNFDQAGWLMDHTALLNEQREVWEKQGCSVLTEAQNSFTLRGSSASLAGKPDLVAQRRDGVTVIDAKSGRPSPHHAIQVMIYMYALPRALERYRGLALSGQVAYPDHVVDIPAAAVDEGFIRNLGGLIRRLAAETSARRVPSPMECRFCEITKADCPDRLEEVPAQEGVTDDF